jgi:hypothetical protein
MCLRATRMLMMPSSVSVLENFNSILLFKKNILFLQTQQLCQYVLNLAKYDQSYDIRDRARFLRPIVFPGEKVSIISLVPNWSWPYQGDRCYIEC